MATEDKIKNREGLLEAVRSLKERGKKIVHCHGSFDLIHPGHMRHLKFAKEQGDILLVSLTGDKFIKKTYLNPFTTENLRAQSVASLEYVDLVYVDENSFATELIKEIKPDIYIKGYEYAKDKKVHPGFIEEKEIVESFGGKIVYSPGDLIFSSSQIINDMLEREDLRIERIHNFLERHEIKKENLIEISNRYKDTKILVVGDIFIEEYVFCTKPKISSSSSILNFDFSNKKRWLGGAGLVSQYIQELGGDTKIICVGNMEFQKALEEIPQDIKNKTEFVKIDTNPLSIKRTFISDDQKIFELNEKIQARIDEKSEEELINKIINSLNGFQAIIFCDYGYGFLNKNIINRVTEEARKKGILCTTIIDGEGVGDILDYKFLDFMVCSEKEVRSVVNNFYDGIDFLSKDFLSRTGYKNLIINLGKGGLICYNPALDPQQISSTYTSYLPFLFNNILDGNGMKEALITSIILSLSSRASIYSALYLGNCIASIESTKKGNEPVTEEELRIFLEGKQ